MIQLNDKVVMTYPVRDALQRAIEKGETGKVVGLAPGNAHTPEDMVLVKWDSGAAGCHYAWRLERVA